LLDFSAETHYHFTPENRPGAAVVATSPAGKEIFSAESLLQADYGSKLQFHGLRLDLRKTFFMRNAG